MLQDNIPILTLDGPSGSGKGTIARRVAERLGWHLLDSGALYRLVALAALRHAIDLDNEAGLVALAAHLDVEFGAENGAERVVLEGEEVTDLLRTEQTGEAASRAAALPRVREALLERQRAFHQAPGLVADGRDMGTVVFPHANIKVFLTASADERARRRHKQLKEKGLDVSLATLSRDIAERDKRDASRAVAPLLPAADAVELDTTGLEIDTVVDKVLELVNRQL